MSSRKRDEIDDLDDLVDLLESIKPIAIYARDQRLERQILDWINLLPEFYIGEVVAEKLKSWLPDAGYGEGFSFENDDVD